MQQSMSHIEDAVNYIRSKIQEIPTIGLIMGSGLGVLGDYIEDSVTIAYDTIPHFPLSTVEGHAGELVIGQLSGKQVILMRGRFHMYEGYEPAVTAFPVRVMKQLGVETLVVTNAAGGINLDFTSGNLMLIADHINMTGKNPLIGANEDAFGPRFPDMSEAYSERLRGIAHQVAQELAIELQEGIYAGLLGPSYETPAEIKMLRVLGADAVGMSTVAEVIAARHSQMEVVGISCISNMAAGILKQPLSHIEVIETTERVKSQFLSLITTMVGRI